MTGNLKWHSCSSNDFPPKRNKVSKACEACRGKKMRCDGMHPCHRCKTSNTECNYDNKSTRPRNNNTIKKEKKVKSEHHPPMVGRKWIFGNDVYETLKTHQSPKTRRYGALPLLCDFFNASAQPQSIWQEFISLFQHCCTFQPSQNSKDYFMRDIPESDQSQLQKSAIQLFSNYNILYSQFIDIPQILSILDPISILSHMQQSRQQKSCPDSLHYILTVIYGILALVFQSAYQTFPLLDENILRELYVYSYQFYNEARKRFLEACFPSTPQASPKKDNQHWPFLLQASILIAHFQCMAIGEDQAWMTIRIGLDIAQRKECIDTLWSPDDDTLQERERCIALIKTIDAWHVWLAFSLQRPYFSEIEIPSSSGKQTWALHVTDAHTLFLKSVLKKKSTDSTSTKMIKESLKSLADHTKELDSDPIRVQIVTLYHSILAIQLFSSQLPFFGTFEGSDTPDAVSLDSTMSTSSHSTDLQDEITLPKEDIAVIKNCIEVAQDILTTVTKILDLGSPPDHKFLPNTTIYSLCLVASFILAIREKKLISEAMPAQQKQTLSCVCKDLQKLLVSIPYPDVSEVIHSKLNESSWLHQRVSSPDSILINEMTPTHASEKVDSHLTKRALDQMAAVPMPTSRALSHIDIEHLEKLSRKSSKTPLSSGFPLSKYNNTSGQKRSNDSAQSNDSYAPAKKRQMVSTIQQQQQLLLQQRQQQQQFQQFQQQQQQQQLQQLQLQQQMTTPTPTTRRLRSSTTSEGIVMQKQNGIDEEHSRNGNVNLLDGLAPESTDPFTYSMWMLGNSVFYHATEQQTLRDGRPTDVFSPLPSMAENSTVTNGTKLQLPQPSKQQAMQHKNWPSAQRSWSNLFIESELQTLHSQTPPMVNLESSYVNSIDLGVMSDTANVGTSIDPTSFLVANNQTTQSEQNIIMYSDNVAPRTAGSFSSQQSNQSSESTSQSNGMVLPVSSWASSPMEQLKQTRANTPDAIWTTNVPFSSQQNSDYTSIQLTRLDRPTMFDGQSNNWIHSEKLSDDLTWN